MHLGIFSDLDTVLNTYCNLGTDIVWKICRLWSRWLQRAQSHSKHWHMVWDSLSLKR